MRSRRIGTHGLALLGLGVLLLAEPPAGWADLNLHRLVCVTPLASLAKDDKIGMTQEELHEALIDRLRATLPRLPVGRTCSNALYLRVSIATKAGEDGRLLGYFGAVRLEALRTAILLDTMSRTEVTAWHGAATLSGPVGDERAALLGALDSLLGSFTAAYHKAGNP